MLSLVIGLALGHETTQIHTNQELKSAWIMGLACLAALWNPAIIMCEPVWVACWLMGVSESSPVLCPSS